MMWLVSANIKEIFKELTQSLKIYLSNLQGMKTKQIKTFKT